MGLCSCMSQEQILPRQAHRLGTRRRGRRACGGEPLLCLGRLVCSLNYTACVPWQFDADDPEEQQRLGGRGIADEGALRLAAGAALLRLARCHDGSIPPLTFCALALTMQVRVSQVAAS